MNSDFKDLISLLVKHNVRYFICGGYAVMLYSEPRYTKDLDIVIGVSESDLSGFRIALAEFGFPMSEEASKELGQPNKMISLGRPPVRIDVLNEISGINFEQAWARRNEIEVDDVVISFISLDDLILSKRAAGRPQDKIDLKQLEKSKRF